MDLDDVPVAAHRAGPAAAAPWHRARGRAPDDPFVAAAASARARERRPGGGRADPGAAAGQGRARSSARTPGGMYFLADALEQATRRRVARHRAVRVAMADPESVLDIGCGIGGDLIAFAEAGLTVAGVDLDPLRAAIAAANLRALGLPGAVSFADATTHGPLAVRRRVRRPGPTVRQGAAPSTRATSCRPGRSSTALLTRPSCVKLAPGLPHAMIPEGIEAEWISDDGGPQGGLPVVLLPRHHRAPGHRHPRRTAWRR